MYKNIPCSQVPEIKKKKCTPDNLHLNLPHKVVLFSEDSGKCSSIHHWKPPKMQTGTFG